MGAVGLASGCRNLGGRTLGVCLFCPSPTAGATRRQQTTLSSIPLRLCVCRIIEQALISYYGALGISSLTGRQAKPASQLLHAMHTPTAKYCSIHTPA